MTERRNPGRGTCRVCEDEFNLTSNGRIRSHGPRDNRCDGGSDLPKEAFPGCACGEPGGVHDKGCPNGLVEPAAENPAEAGPNPHRAPLPTAQPTETAPIGFTAAVPVSQTPTVRGGESVRPGPEKSDFDQWGRYKIPDPATGAVTGRQRVTTFAKMISDQWGLSQWQQRKLLIGAAENPSITAVAAGKDAKSDKAFLDSLADTLKDAAGAKDAAAHGTTVHSFTERVDMGLMSLGEIPDQYREDVAAYRYEIENAGLITLPEMVERTTMVRSLDVTGTLDRIFQLPNGEYVIGDVKTGADLSYGWLDIGVQLACYAHGVNENGVFDWGSRQWLPAPKVRTDFAIVMHTPAGRGTCTLYRVDIEQGWANCALARSVRDARKVRNHAEVLDPDSIRIPGPENTRGAELVPLTVQPHSESFAGPDPARVSAEDLADWSDRMRRVRTQVFAGELYQQAYDAGAPAEFLQELAFIGKEALEKRGRACRVMAEVTSQGAAAELYSYAAEVWPDDAEFLGELTAIGMNALTVAGYQVMS